MHLQGHGFQVMFYKVLDFRPLNIYSMKETTHSSHYNGEIEGLGKK